MDISLTDREADVMQILWERGPSVVSEVRAGLSAEPQHVGHGARQSDEA